MADTVLQKAPNAIRGHLVSHKSCLIHAKASVVLDKQELHWYLTMENFAVYDKAEVWWLSCFPCRKCSSPVDTAAGKAEAAHTVTNQLASFVALA